jgi:hypothetical protein
LESACAIAAAGIKLAHSKWPMKYVRERRNMRVHLLWVEEKCRPLSDRQDQDKFGMPMRQALLHQRFFI